MYAGERRFFVGDAAAPPHPLGWRYVGRGGCAVCALALALAPRVRWLSRFKWYKVAIAKEETLGALCLATGTYVILTA